jgi:hypothetical protein
MDATRTTEVISEMSRFAAVAVYAVVALTTIAPRPGLETVAMISAVVGAGAGAETTKTSGAGRGHEVAATAVAAVAAADEEAGAEAEGEADTAAMVARIGIIAAVGIDGEVPAVVVTAAVAMTVIDTGTGGTGENVTAVAVGDMTGGEVVAGDKIEIREKANWYHGIWYA